MKAKGGSLEILIKLINFLLDWSRNKRREIGKAITKAGGESWWKPSTWVTLQSGLAAIPNGTGIVLGYL